MNKKTSLIFFIVLLFCNSCSSFLANSEDSNIESHAKIDISNSQLAKTDTNISFKSFNKILLITGQVPQQSDKELISKIAEKIPNVRLVHNELEVSPKLSTSFKDAIISTKIKTRFVGSDNINAEKIKVVIENGSVYLMGTVTQLESTIATKEVQQVSNVKKIVKVFEYLKN